MEYYDRSLLSLICLGRFRGETGVDGLSLSTCDSGGLCSASGRGRESVTAASPHIPGDWFRAGEDVGGEFHHFIFVSSSSPASPANKRCAVLPRSSSSAPSSVSSSLPPYSYFGLSFCPFLPAVLPSRVNSMS